MKVSDDDFGAAAAWADEQLAGRTDDQRWELLRELMEHVRSRTGALISDAEELIEQATEAWRGMTAGDVKRELNRALRESSDASDDMHRALRLEAVRARVAPHVTRARWNKGLNPQTDFEKWIHTERLRDAAYLRSNRPS